MLSLFLVALGVVLVTFSNSLAKKAQRNLSKIVGDAHDKGEMIRRRIELLIVGVPSLLIGLWFLVKRFIF